MNPWAAIAIAVAVLAREGAPVATAAVRGHYARAARRDEAKAAAARGETG